MELTQRYRDKFWTAIVCLVVSLGSAWVVSIGGLIAGVAILGLVLSLGILLFIFNNYRDGFLLLLLYGFFMFHIYRMLPASPASFPMGTIVEILLVLISISILLHQTNDGHLNAGFYKNPISLALLMFSSYTILLLFHPLSAAITGRILAVREIVMLLLLYFISIHVFRTYSFIYRFAGVWIFLALMAALYGIYQEVFGLQSWELKWLYSGPDHGRLAIIWGHIRKWSFLSDINAFGLLMSYSGLVCLVLALGPIHYAKKIFLIGCSLLMFISMTFSGTRTAMAMVVFGLVFYIVATLNRKTSLAVLVAFSIGMLALFYGPFYGPNFNRLRSTFSGSKDPSMNMRDNTRERMQPYVRLHPLGGGLNTTGVLGLKYDPSHELAGNWDTDSGYLKTALERGWVGLLIQLGLYATIMIYGLKFFYSTRDPIAASYCCAYLTGFFALTVANYAQDALDQKPMNIIVMGSIASIIGLYTLNKNNKYDA